MDRWSRTAYDAVRTPRGDLAFADTVVLDELEPIPLSGIVVSDETGAERHMRPLVFPPVARAGGSARARGPDATMLDRMRRGVIASRVELSELWDATADDDDPSVSRRVKTMLSFFEWDRADLLRAAWIGLAVFFAAATVGALVLEV